MATTEKANMAPLMEAGSKEETLGDLDKSILDIEAELIKLSAKTATKEKTDYFQKCKEALIKAKEREIKEQALQKQIFQQAFGKLSLLFATGQDAVKLSEKEEKEWNDSCTEVINAEVKKVEKKRGDLLANRDALLVAKRSILATFNDEGAVNEIEAPLDTIARLTKENERLLKEHKELRVAIARLDADATKSSAGKSSQIEDLRKEIRALEATADEYRSKNASLIAEGWTATSTLNEKDFDIKTANEKVAKLEKQIQEMVTENQENDSAMKAVNEKVTKLEKQIEHMTSVYKVGAAARLGFMEMTKRVGAVPVRGTPDLAVIEARNEAVHSGNFISDHCLVHFNPFTPRNETQIAYFHELYGVPKVYSIMSNELREILSMRGTMMSCRSGTKYTFSEEDDERFSQLLDESWAIWKGLEAEFPSNKATIGKKFGENKKIDKNMVEMQKIVDKFVRLERRELNKRGSGYVATNGLYEP